jgi:hypothetical protein
VVTMVGVGKDETSFLMVDRHRRKKLDWEKEAGRDNPKVFVHRKQLDGVSAVARPTIRSMRVVFVQCAENRHLHVPNVSWRC